MSCGTSVSFVHAQRTSPRLGRRRHDSRFEGMGIKKAAHLFEGLVVDKACSVLGDFELPLLDVLAELPTYDISVKEWGVWHGESY